MSRRLLLCLAVAWSASAFAQDSRPTSKPTAPTPAPDPASSEDEEANGDDDRWLAVHAGEVHPAVGPVQRDVTILAKNGAIVAMGRDLVVPESAEVLDAKAYRVYPGLVAWDTGGIVGMPPQDSTDVYGLNMTLALSVGITTVGAGPSICKLTYGTLEGHVLGSRSLVSLDVSSSKARRTLVSELEKVREHQRKARAATLAKARGDEAKKVSPLKGRLASLHKLVTGGAQASFKARTQRDLRYLADLCSRYGIRAVVEGGEEAWVVAPELGRAGCAVIVVPRARRGEDERVNRPSGWSIENAAKLHEAGVRIAIMSRSKGISMGGLAGRDLFTLPLEAAFAVRGGLPPEAALQALTIGPARLLGVDDRVGSIEVGKDCDLVILRGDLLDYETLAEWTVVNGRVAYDKEKESLLQAVRSRAKEGKNVKVPQIWPRPEGEPEPEQD